MITLLSFNELDLNSTIENLHFLRQKGDKFNSLRLTAAQMLMGEDEISVFQSFPLLFHFNIEGLPGYTDKNIPFGISEFSITDASHSVASRFLKVTLPKHPPTIEPEIIGLYAMGSTSSIGQSSESDFDIWICYSHTLDNKRVELLNEKSWAISQWAESFGVELNFFLVPDNKFKTLNESGMSGDNCGSTQHMLLLDEFYRTALRVAGKRILWQHVKIEREEDYDEYVAIAYEKKTIIADEWLDLGGLHYIPAEEYFGANLWQLYKGIDTPYKSILKAILMEAYSWEYPNTLLVSSIYKKAFHDLSIPNEEQDPYCLMLEKVTDYLTRINDSERLNLVRMAFYLKTEENLSKESRNKNTYWRRDILNKYITAWGWDQKELVRLDNRSNWKVAEVRRAKNRLLSAFMISYQNLLRFARESHISDSIKPEDIGVLSRKLYAAYEDLPGKIELINPKISKNLFEANLSFIQVPQGRKNQAGWYLYNSTLDKFSLTSTKPVLYARYLSKLISWCYINGLYEEETKLHIYNQGSDVSDEKLNLFIKNIYNVFPLYTPKATNQELIKPCEVKYLTVSLNVETDPTLYWGGAERSPEKLMKSVFSFGDEEECLIGSIDLVYRNSWNEVRTLHFNNRYSVVDAINTILGKMHKGANHPEQVCIFNYSSNFNDRITRSFKAILSKYINIRLNGGNEKRIEQFRMGGKKFAFHFDRVGVSLQRLNSSCDLYTQISNDKLSANENALRNTFYKKTIEMIEGNVSEGLIQFFFENYTDGFNVYVASEENEIKSYHQIAGSKDELVQNVNRFYASKAAPPKENKAQPTYFNLPQFYDISEGENKNLILTTFASSYQVAESILIKNK